MLLMKSKGDHKSYQYYIYWMIRADFIYIQILVNLPKESTLYHIQNGKPKLIVYASKRLPEAAKNYCITELESCGLAINIASFTHFMKKLDFDAIVDHLALTHIIKSKAERATNRINRLIEVLSSYSFNLYYIKVNICYSVIFLSRQKHDGIDSLNIIPISFYMQEVLHARYYNIHENEQKRYLTQTESKAKTSLPKVHGIDKGVDPNVQLEKQMIRLVVTPVQSHFH